MTERLYEQDSHLFSFFAVVHSVYETERGWCISLDRTAFFPEGGGQAGDQGEIDGSRIYDTQLHNGDILHFTKEKPTFCAGDTVSCAIDASLRFFRMQAHSGEHVVSGLAHRICGAENVGFHMNGFLMTVDFDRVISKDTLDEIELEANRCVYRNVPVRAWFPNPEEEKTIQYRSKLDQVDRLRLVEIEGYDICACCAPHVSRTGEIGLIKIMSAVSHRGGIRITLLCGEAAYADYAVKYKNARYCADLLKAKPNDLAAAFDAQMEKEALLKRKFAQESHRFTELVLAGAPKPSGACACVVLPDASGEELCRIADGLSEKFGLVGAAFCGDDCKGYSFAFVAEKENQIAAVKALLPRLKGRGGGRGQIIQGKCTASQAEIRGILSDFKTEDG